MPHPGLLSLRIGFHGLQGVLIHMIDQVGQPLDMLFYRRDDIGEHRRAARACDSEQIGKAFDGDAQIRHRAMRPFVTQRQSLTTAYIDLQQRTRHGVETRSEDQHIDLVMPVARPDAIGHKGFDGVFQHIDERHIFAVEHRVIVRVEAYATPPQRIARRFQRRRRCRIGDRFLDFPMDHLRDFIIGRFVHDQIPEHPEQIEAAALPRAVKGAATLLGFIAECLAIGNGPQVPCRMPTRLLPTRAVGAFDFLDERSRQRRVTRGQGETGCALKHEQPVGFLCDFRRHLNT